MTRAVAMVLVLAAALPARADDEQALARARSHFEIGRGYFRLGNYAEAVREFTAGYDLAPRPQFLLNLGQCYRALHENARARAMLEKFLADAPADDPERPAVLKLVEELKQQPDERAPAAAPAPVAPAAAPAAGVAVAPTDAGSRPTFVQRHWWIFPVGAVVLAGVAVGIYFGARPSDACSDAGGRCLRVLSP
jgi:tetratricopeptide (TPR) repeat protein